MATQTLKHGDVNSVVYILIFVFDGTIHRPSRLHAMLRFVDCGVWTPDLIHITEVSVSADGPLQGVS